MPFPSSTHRGPSDDWGRTTDEQEDLDSLGFQEMKEATEKVPDEDEEESDVEKEKVAVVVVEEDEDIDGLAELERLAARTREEQDAIVIEEEEEI